MQEHQLQLPTSDDHITFRIKRKGKLPIGPSFFHTMLFLIWVAEWEGMETRALPDPSELTTCMVACPPFLLYLPACGLFYPSNGEHTGQGHGQDCRPVNLVAGWSRSSRKSERHACRNPDISVFCIWRVLDSFDGSGIKTCSFRPCLVRKNFSFCLL